MVTILDGEALRDTLIPTLKQQIAQASGQPQLVIIQIGSLEESNSYIKKKKLFGQSLGALVVHKQYPEDVTEETVIADINSYNADPSVHGIMIQLPLPAHLRSGEIIEAIDARKDVDGLTAQNMKLLFDNTEAFVPATTQGILTLLEHHRVSLIGKKVVIVGESALVGRPTALAFLNRKSTVTICHIDTAELAGETKQADILVVAVGKPHLIGAEHVKAGQVVIDVGITVTPDHEVQGDVNFAQVKDIVRAITPVPGGVGPMTVYSLFENLVKAFVRADYR